MMTATRFDLDWYLCYDASDWIDMRVLLNTIYNPQQQQQPPPIVFSLLCGVRTTARDLPVVRQSGEQLYGWTRAM